MELQAAMSRERLAEKVGRTIDVLVDAVEGGHAIGRSSADAPEIDGVVRLRGAKGVAPGDLVRAKVTASGDHDLEAKVLSAEDGLHGIHQR
jgi:ribosomal protein S12 methylthiotransferase